MSDSLSAELESILDIPSIQTLSPQDIAGYREFYRAVRRWSEITEAPSVMPLSGTSFKVVKDSASLVSVTILVKDGERTQPLELTLHELEDMVRPDIATGESAALSGGHYLSSTVPPHPSSASVSKQSLRASPMPEQAVLSTVQEVGSRGKGRNPSLDINGLIQTLSPQDIAGYREFYRAVRRWSEITEAPSVMPLSGTSFKVVKDSASLVSVTILVKDGERTQPLELTLRELEDMVCPDIATGESAALSGGHYLSSMRTVPPHPSSASISKQSSSASPVPEQPIVSTIQEVMTSNVYVIPSARDQHEVRGASHQGTTSLISVPLGSRLYAKKNPAPARLSQHVAEHGENPPLKRQAVPFTPSIQGHPPELPSKVVPSFLTNLVQPALLPKKWQATLPRGGFIARDEAFHHRQDDIQDQDCHHYRLLTVTSINYSSRRSVGAVIHGIQDLMSREATELVGDIITGVDTEAIMKQHLKNIRSRASL
ncbi:hypothetical protein H0H93_000450 [Arthromyces matolae]|nr:hypothetical protein H0H93_000450 [Arthromyces matolae]